MRTLLVHFLPRGERSRTRRLLDAFRAEAGMHEMEEVDLANNVPPVFNAVTVPLYVQRNYRGETLLEFEQSKLEGLDKLVEQLKRSDLIVLAFPVFNFSVPAAVKAWMDCVMQKNRTWTIDSSGYRGLLAGKKALILMTAGGVYDGARAVWDHAGPLARHAFEFMGFTDIRLVRACGMNRHPDEAQRVLKHAEDETRDIAREWLADEPVLHGR